MIYRGLYFLAVLWFGSSPTLSSPISKRDILLTGEGGAACGAEATKPYDRKKTWSSILANHSISDISLNPVIIKQIHTVNF